MPILIDGYNLLFATGIAGGGNGPRGLERSRGALVQHVSRALDALGDRDVTIVFDAAGAPPGLPSSFEHHGVQVRFAKGYPSADEMLEELIRAHSSPRRLTVVSSDHRVQQAAKRRRAKTVDADVWFEQVEQLQREQGAKAKDASSVAQDRSLDPGVEYWLAQFVDDKPVSESAGDAMFPASYLQQVADELKKAERRRGSDK